MTSNSPQNLSIDFQITGHEVFTVRDMEWLGTKNGRLLELMSQNNFGVLITNDKNLYYQQKVTSLTVCVLNINSKTNRYDDVLEIIDAIKNKIKEVEIHLLSSSGGYFIV